ncbi:MAG: hypothetical protein JWQ18_830 [Conexibacter sp.]|nr:hypothetical protein [Conexibacter sp.]
MLSLVPRTRTHAFGTFAALLVTAALSALAGAAPVYADLAASQAANDQHAAQARAEAQTIGNQAEITKRFGVRPAPVPPASAPLRRSDQAPDAATSTLIPDPPAAPNSLVTPMSSPTGPNGTLRYKFSISAPYVGLRDVVNGMIVGEGRNGWGFEWAPNHWNNNANFKFGWTEGSSSTGLVQHCLYVPDPSSNLVDGTTAPTHDCTYVGELHMPDYALSWNGNNQGVNCSGASCDGQYTTIDASKCPWGTPQYANVQPWITNGSGMRGESLRTLNPGQVVFWRYITKDYRHVLVNIHGLGSGAQSWGWIWSDCITNYGPYVYAPDPNL